MQLVIPIVHRTNHESVPLAWWHSVRFRRRSNGVHGKYASDKLEISADLLHRHMVAVSSNVMAQFARKVRVDVRDGVFPSSNLKCRRGCFSIARPLGVSRYVFVSLGWLGRVGGFRSDIGLSIALRNDSLVNRS